MKTLRLLALRTALVIAFGALAFAPSHARAATAAEITAASRAALRDLYAANSSALAIGHRASAVLVFPSITKAGFVVAAHHGEGALITHHGTAGYYNTVAASYGLQAGIQKFGYALFFMNSRAMGHLHDRGGWALGSAPSLVVVDKGISGSLSTTNLNKDIYAFFFNQKGLMGGLGLQGSKITQIYPR
jgi:lipid-binding SYLF domain-containing protein